MADRLSCGRSKTFDKSADWFELRIVAGLQPFEGHHLGADDVDAVRRHTAKSRFLVRCVARADSVSDNGDREAAVAQVEHGLQHADMGFCSADNECLAIIGQLFEEPRLAA